MLPSPPFSRPVVSTFLLAVAVAVAVAGCTTTGPVRSDYDAEANVTEYETNPVSIPGSEWGGGYGSTKSLEVQARAQCRGQRCTPGQVTLVFQVSGSGSLKMQNQAVALRADGETIASTRGRAVGGGVDNLASAIGVVATLQVPFSDFRTIAEVDRLSGTIGTTNFRLRHSSRDPFRALIQEATAPAETESSENTS